MKILASVRVRSGHGPETDYELLHVEESGRPAIVVRLVHGEETRPAEILIDDLPRFLAEWDRFVKDAQRRGGISLERKPPEVPYIPVRKAQKIGGLPREPAAPKPPDEHDIIAFQLSNPPTADAVTSTVQAQPSHLVVISPIVLVSAVEEHLASLQSGLVAEPQGFTRIVVRRDGRPQSSKKFRTDLSLGIARMLGEPKSVLWILPVG